ncbi:MAG: hypothetical protein R3E77_15030 [Steroidobacteraceae bacterium]
MNGICRFRYALLALAILVVGLSPPSFAQSSLFDEVRTLGNAVEPVEQPVTIATAGAYRLTVTDIGQPAPLTSLAVAVTQNESKLATLTSAGNTTFDAATAGQFVVRVVGQLAAQMDSGSVGLLLEPVAGGNPVLQQVVALRAKTPGTVSTRSVIDAAFDIATAGTFEVTLGDFAFPSPLASMSLAITREGSSSIALQMSGAGTASFAAQSGRYRIFVIADAAAAVVAGAYSVRVRDPSTDAALFAKIEPVGLARYVGEIDLAGGTHRAIATDFTFPSPLAGVGLLVVRDGVAVATATSAQPQTFQATAGVHTLLAYAAAANSQSVGAYGLALTDGAGSEEFSVVDVAPAVSAADARAFTFAASVASAGRYDLQIVDFAFPQSLSAINWAVAQNGQVLASGSNATTIAVDLEAGPAFILVLADRPSATASGLFGVQLTHSSGAPVVFENTKAVGALSQTRVLSIATAGRYDVAVTDLGFPVGFSELAAVVTRGSNRDGSIFGGGQFSFDATPGNYLLTFIAKVDPAGGFGSYRLHVQAAPPPPTINLTASAASVTRGGTVTLNWSVTDADNCSASGGWSGSRQATGGSEMSSPVNATTTFTLSCQGRGGSATASTTVNPTDPRTSSGGGGSINPQLLWLLAGLLATKHMVNPRRRRIPRK